MGLCASRRRTPPVTTSAETAESGSESPKEDTPLRPRACLSSSATSVEVALRAGISAGEKALGLRERVPPTPRDLPDRGPSRNHYWIVVRDKHGVLREPPLVFDRWLDASRLVGDRAGGRYALGAAGVHHAWPSAIERDAYLLGVRYVLERRR